MTQYLHLHQRAMVRHPPWASAGGGRPMRNPVPGAWPFGHHCLRPSEHHRREAAVPGEEGPGTRVHRSRPGRRRSARRARPSAS